MTAFKSEFLNELQWRGFIHQTSNAEGIDALAARGEIVAYVGNDCTAPSLHIGHPISAMLSHWLLETGPGNPIAFMCGGATRVGCPSRQEQTPQILNLVQV